MYQRSVMRLDHSIIVETITDYKGIQVNTALRIPLPFQVTL